MRKDEANLNPNPKPEKKGKHFCQLVSALELKVLSERVGTGASRRRSGRLNEEAHRTRGSELLLAEARVYCE